MAGGDGPLTILQYGDRICNRYPNDPTWNEHLEYMRSLPDHDWTSCRHRRPSRYHEAMVRLDRCTWSLYLDSIPTEAADPTRTEDPAFLALFEGMEEAEAALDSCYPRRVDVARLHRRVVGECLQDRGVERETGLEPATSCLEGKSSTTELLPPVATPL